MKTLNNMTIWVIMSMMSRTSEAAHNNFSVDDTDSDRAECN